MEEIILIKPSLQYKNQAKELIEETKKYDANNINIWSGFASMQKFDKYEDWLQKLDNDLDFENIKPGRVPAATYFSVKKSSNQIVGIVNIRYKLNEYLENYCGHIGYSIRFTERRKGYGHKQLCLALEECSRLNIKDVLITCRESNIASKKTIESCGGIYEDTRYSETEKDSFSRFWIRLN